MTVDVQTILSTVIAGLLLAVIAGGFLLRDAVTRLQAEFTSFRHEVIRFMEHTQPKQGD